MPEQLNQRHDDVRQVYDQEADHHRDEHARRRVLACTDRSDQIDQINQYEMQSIDRLID